MRPLPPPPRGRPRRAPRVLALLLVCAALSFLCAATRAEAARGRPYVNAAKTTFVADNGNLLRGAIISTETGSSPSVAQLEGMKAVGLNAVHCYAERRDYGYSAGARVAAVDLAVQRTRDAGLYLVITIGGGGFDANFNSAFWSFYAPRYAHETHVLYEIQNEPAAGSPPYSGNAALMQMQLTCYNIIRAAAPDTPVMFMSYSSFENGPGVLQDIAALGSAVDWSKACIAFHGYGERGPAAIRQCLETVLAAGYPCFQTEFYRWPWGTGNFALGSGPSLYQDVDETGDLERLGVSWLSFLTITGVTNAARFKTPLNNGGVTWTPDFGTWPVPGRAVFGNGGEPRLASRATTVRIQAEDFDLGGQGVAYHDATATNSGGAYRPGEGVDIQATTDTGGGHNVGWISSGEWLEYTTIIREAGLYTLGLRVASPQTSNSLRVRLAGVDLTGAWAFAGTGANQTWATISRTVNLPPGQQVLRVEALSTGFNLNWIEIAPVSAGVLPNGAYRVLARSTGKALGVVGASTSNGAKLEQRSYAAATHQRWTFTHRGANHYTITSAQTGRAIDSAAGSSLSGDNLGMWGVSGSVGTLNQRWIVTATDSGHHKLINANTGLAMEIASASTADGARIQTSEYAGGAHQQWSLGAPFAVSITAPDADLGGVEGNGGQLLVSRDVAYSTSLTVNLARSGTAVAGTDYAAPPASITIPAGAESVAISVSTIPGQLPPQDRELVVSIAPGTGYDVVAPSSATLTIRARDAFAQWVAATFSAPEQADPLVSGPLAAPFGDGLPNLLRGALNLGPGPGPAAASLPAITTEDGHLVLRYRQLSGGQGAPGIDYVAGGLRYVVEVAERLDSDAWSSGASVVEPLGVPQVIDAGTEFVAVRMKAPLAEQPRAFMRLRVVRVVP